MIQRIEQGSKKAYDSLFAALRMKETIQEVVSVTGGGGKTTLIRRLQQDYQKQMQHYSCNLHHLLQNNQDMHPRPPLSSRLHNLYTEELHLFVFYEF